MTIDPASEVPTVFFWLQPANAAGYEDDREQVVAVVRHPFRELPDRSRVLLFPHRATFRLSVPAG